MRAARFKRLLFWGIRDGIMQMVLRHPLRHHHMLILVTINTLKHHLLSIFQPYVLGHLFLLVPISFFLPMPIFLEGTAASLKVR
jgi:hypothetical protein